MAPTQVQQLLLLTCLFCVFACFTTISAQNQPSALDISPEDGPNSDQAILNDRKRPKPLLPRIHTQRRMGGNGEENTFKKREKRQYYGYGYGSYYPYSYYGYSSYYYPYYYGGYGNYGNYGGYGNNVGTNNIGNGNGFGGYGLGQGGYNGGYAICTNGGAQIGRCYLQGPTEDAVCTALGGTCVNGGCCTTPAGKR